MTTRWYHGALKLIRIDTNGLTHWRRSCGYKMSHYYESSVSIKNCGMELDRRALSRDIQIKQYHVTEGIQ